MEREEAVRGSFDLQKIRRGILSLWGIMHMGAYYRFLVISRKLREYPFTDALDAGCGTGIFSQYIARRFPAAKVTAIDISDAEFPPDGRIGFRKEDICGISYRERFDLILNVDVIEHIDDYQAVFTKFYEALRSKGVLIIHTPNETQRRFMKRFERWNIPDHVRKGFVLDKLAAELKAKGFEILEAGYTAGAMANIAWEMDRITDRTKIIKLLIFPFLKLLSFIDSRMRHKIGNGLLIVARKP